MDNQLAEDRLPAHPLIEFEFLQSYFNFKDRLKNESGLGFGVDYSTVLLTGGESLGADNAASGMVRIFGTWQLVGRESNDSGALTYKIEHRHGYTDVAPSGFASELGYVGLIEPPFSDAGFILGNLYWRQTFGQGRFVLVGGWVDATDYVDAYALASPWMHFMNFAFSTGSATIPVPNQGLGVAGGAWISDNIYILAGFADSNSDPHKPGDGFDTFFNDNEYFKHVEVGWTTSPDRAYFDNVHVTYWHADERKAAEVPDGWGINWSATYYVDDTWLPFFRGGYAKDGGSLLEASVSSGFGYQSVPGSHLLGFGFNWGRPNVSTFAPDLDDQYGFEWFYRWMMTEQLAVTPDFQLLFNPALNPAEGTVWVFGLRARLAL